MLNSQKLVQWHELNKKEVIEQLKSSERGLTSLEASKRLSKYGKNEIKQLFKIHPLLIFFQQFNSIFIYILLSAAIFSLFIGHYIDLIVILIIIILNSTIGFFQQYKAEKTILEMKNMLVPKVKVYRQGILTEIISTELVPGDILAISEGDKIMADCRIIDSNELQTNEAVLTGESFPQIKNSEKLHKEAELADRSNMIYMGTLAVRGNGKAIVVATGMETEFGKIASLVQSFKTEKTPLEKKFDSFSKKVGVAVIFLSIITMAIGFLRGEDKFDMILSGIALAVSVMPEGLPAVIAITLALAIKRMQKKNSLIRKLPAAETLGRTTVICVDKTGTLTEEEMTVTDLYCNNKIIKLTGNYFLLNNKKIELLKNKELLMLLRIGLMCNNARIEEDHVKNENETKVFGDPTEKSLIFSAIKADMHKKQETEKEIRLIEYSFSSNRKMMTIVRKGNRNPISYVKGSPGIILDRCSKELVNGRVIDLTNKRKEELHAVYENMASKALRVLGFAYRPLQNKFNQQMAENNLVFVGFQGMLDPPRKEVKPAIKECINAGIKIKMITGDSLLTAKAVSEMIGLKGESIEAKELEKLSYEDFVKVVREKVIFARINPELKLKIVKTLKEQGEIIAVTGDGVNDVLALKEAHIGVAMGIRGTEVTREAADIILLDDNFNSIVSSVREGRRVYDNLKKSIKFHLSANIHELLLVLFALIFAMPIPLLPLAILWMNLITDSMPSIALSVEKEEPKIMKRRPINPQKDILSGLYWFILLAGIIAFSVSIILFSFFYNDDLAKARTIVSTNCVFNELFLVFTCRSNEKMLWKFGFFSNKFLIFAVLLTAVLQVMAIYTPLAKVFEFVPLSLGELMLAVSTASVSLIFFEVVKYIKYKK